MNNPIEALIQQNAAGQRFAATSRYHGLPTLSLAQPDGHAITYVTRRFIDPSASASGAENMHVVTRGERPDHLAHAYLGDPEQYWKLCDLNETLVPGDLTAEPGATVLIPGAGGGLPGFSGLFHV